MRTHLTVLDDHTESRVEAELRELGVDPMGDEYFARRTALEEAGVPIYRPLPDWQ